MRSATLGILLLLLAGCGTPSSSPPVAHPTVTKEPVATASPRVLMITSGAKYAFAPKQITIAKGTTVTWRNNSNADHTVTADSGAWSSINIGHGQSYSRTFTKPGRYAYVCGLHGYMTGVVVVT
jgi:plastocyanin